MSGGINDLRDTLAEAMKAVRDGTLDTDKARTINSLAQTMVDSARVEVEYLRATGGGESEYMEKPKTPKAGELPNGVTAIVQHRLNG